MNQLVTLGILIGVLILVVLALFAWFIANRRSKEGPLEKEAHAMVRDAQIEPYMDRPSSEVSEQIEQMVKQKIAAYADLADTIIDFGSTPDGGVAVWINKHQYDRVEDIPDDRIKKAVQEAVQKFNAG
jgi:hypothetical protein